VRRRAGLAAAGVALLAAALLAPPPVAAQAPEPSAPPAAGAPEAGRDAAAAEAEAAATTTEAEADAAGPPEAVGPLPDPPRSDPAVQTADEAAAIEALFEEWESRAAVARTAIANDRASTAAFEVLREVLVGHRAAARALAARTEALAQPLRRQLEALGPSPAEGEAEAASVAAERRELNRRLATLEARSRKAEFARARADTLIEKIGELIRRRVAEEFLTRGPTPLDPSLWPGAIAEYLELAGRLGNEVAFAFHDPVRNRERIRYLPIIAAALVAAPLLAVVLRRRAVRLIRDRFQPETSRARRVAASALAAFVRAFLLSMALGALLTALALLDVFGPIGNDVILVSIRGLATLVLARSLSLAWYAPDEPSLRLSVLDERDARAAARHAAILGVVAFAESILVLEFASAGLSAGTLAVANLAVLTPGALTLWALAGYVAPSPGDARPADAAAAASAEPGAEEEQSVPPSQRIRAFGAVGLRIAAVVSILLAVAGFFVASKFTFFAPALTLALITLGMVLFSLLDEGIESYVETRREGAEGLRLIPVFFAVLLILAGLPPLALIWGMRPADLVEVWNLIVGGVQVGDVTISPAEIVTFFIVFGVGYTLTRLLQAALNTSVLPKTKLDAGGRTALVSGVGYIGVALAALAAISSAGLDLSNLAIVAGALSVGIGFGLQTIVNNFVSGIILLIERPVKVGDWIEVGGVHGNVRRINVRATEIVTFDRSALILPNSQLISGTVTNYTLTNHLGRLIIPVGVAYGSDVRLVERILTQIGQAERRVLQYPPPQVLFLRFGPDALEFELRVILRDVNTILQVRSDLHFEVERRFREAGVEIPFAQRVVHLRMPDGAAMPAGAAAPEAAPRSEETP